MKVEIEITTEQFYAECGRPEVDIVSEILNLLSEKFKDNYSKNEYNNSVQVRAGCVGIMRMKRT